MVYKLGDIELKKIQNEQLQLLKEFDRICRKYNIKYHLMAGTLLGAIRHNGFIPWDDDIDVCLLRKDYETIKKVLEKELNPKYFLQTHVTDKNYLMKFAKIRKNDTIFLEKSVADLDIHHGIYIDIFPLDNVSPNTLKGKLHQNLTYIVGRINLARSKSICLNANNNLDKYGGLLAYYLLKMVPKKWTDNLQEFIITLFKNKEMEYVSHLTNGASKNRYYKYMMKTSEFYKVDYGKFEGYNFLIPSDSHNVLSKLFGEYMQLPPKKEREPHHGVIKVEL